VMPLLGITAVGHEWKIHISWKVDETGETVSLLTIARALTN